MKLSVIIVNYNVKFFLEQCIISAKKAAEKVPTEIIVIDNQSVDGSIEMMHDKFPEITFIANKDNVGFSKANNQGMRIAKGEYVLLLNPDTVVEEDTFEKCIQFMDAHPEAGGLGVKMVDGKGNFLPESKRGLPTPAVAFYKIFGLSSLFPKSKKFGQYHLGYLDKESTNKVDILAGAYMLMRKSVLDQVGLLDEDFFMYGEDIDLSWRIKLGGYENYYFPETRIIHYKGESTKKSSINYVFVFYNAMVIFAQKHFSKSNASLFSMFINIAIYLRAGVAIVKRFLEKGVVPFIDFTAIYGSLYLIKELYEDYTDIAPPSNIVNTFYVVYGVITLLSLYLNGGYDKPVKLIRIFRGVFLAWISVLLIYSLLDSDLRFSRIIIVLSGIGTFGVLTFLRGIYHSLKIKGYQFFTSNSKRQAVIGFPEEILRVRELIKQTGLQPEFEVEVVPENGFKNESDHFIGNIGQLPELIETFKINEIIFCAKDVSSEQIISQMSLLENKNLEYKIAPPGSSFIIGSNSINTTGELYSVLNINNISSPENRRKKWLFDRIVSIILLVSSPLLVFIIPQPFQFLSNVFSVLIGKHTWIGYYPFSEQKNILPSCKKGILTIGDFYDSQNNNLELLKKHNINYAKDYTIEKDWSILWRSFKRLGRHIR